MYEKSQGAFVYYPGAVMCNLFLADEINRTSAKTQSALLEVMEEGNVTVDGESHPVPEPFLVFATENPLGSAGNSDAPGVTAGPFHDLRGHGISGERGRDPDPHREKREQVRSPGQRR